MRVLFFLCLCACLGAGLPARSQVNAWTYHNDNGRTGANTNETVLTPANVNATTFGKLFSYPVDGLVYAQPLYTPNVSIPGRGWRNVLFIATEHNTVYAFDADSAGASGGLLWKTNLGPAAVTTIAGVFTNRNFGTRYNNNSFTDITPEVGITGTPVIDVNTGTLYVDAFTGEPGGGVTNYFHRLHALKITDGTEQPYSPVVVTASVPGNGVGSTNGRIYFNAQQHLQRSALTLAGGRVYVTFASYADTDPYHGWVIGFNATNLVQPTNYVFNTTPNSTSGQFGANAGEGGIWMSGSGPAVDSSTNLYFVVGNGAFNATNNTGGTEYGNSFIKLATASGLSVLDYFAPYDESYLSANDLDLGAGGVMLLPNQPGLNPRVMIGAGKNGKIYVLNRDQLTTDNTHFAPFSMVDPVLQTDNSRLSGGGVFSTPAYFNSRVYYCASGDFLKAFAISNGLLAAGTLTDTARTFSFPGVTPSISANGASNGLVWAIRRANPALLVACNATNLNEVYTSADAAANRDQLATGVKFAVPTVADGKVFVGTASSVSVFGLLAGTFAFAAPTYSVVQANTVATIGVNRLGGTNGAVQVAYATVAGGTAVSGQDYSNTSGTLTWTNGESGTKFFNVTILASGQGGGNKTVNLALNSPTGNSALGPQSAVVLTIVSSNATPSDIWRLAHFGANAGNPAIAGDNADPDNDGVPNLLEYAWATDPLVANPSAFGCARLGGNLFQLRFPRNTTASDIYLDVQTATNLNAWITLMTYSPGPGWQAFIGGWSVSESGAFGTPPDQFVNVSITSLSNIAGGGVTNRFFRLRVRR
jgi:hypothetical protein